MSVLLRVLECAHDPAPVACAVETIAGPPWFGACGLLRWSSFSHDKQH